MPGWKYISFHIHVLDAEKPCGRDTFRRDQKYHGSSQVCPSVFLVCGSWHRSAHGVIFGCWRPFLEWFVWFPVNVHSHVFQWDAAGWLVHSVGDALDEELGTWMKWKPMTVWLLIYHLCGPERLFFFSLSISLLEVGSSCLRPSRTEVLYLLCCALLFSPILIK